LEEPSGQSLIILISPHWQMLLPTIVSRCQLIKFLPVPEKEIFEKLKSEAKSEKEITRVVKLSAGRPGRAIKILQEKEWLNNQKINVANFKKILQSDLVSRWIVAKQLSQNIGVAQETLSQWTLWLRDRIFEGSGCANLLLGEKEEIKYPAKNLLNLIKAIQKSQIILDNPSFNARLALEILMMKI
jgi:DNA polymerase-3 subunit delta'